MGVVQLLTIKTKCVGLVWKLSMHPEIDLLLTQFHIPATLRR